MVKWETAKEYVPTPQFYDNKIENDYAMLFFGTSIYAAEEAMDLLKEQGVDMNAIRIKAFPFNDEVKAFIKSHKKVFVIEQNRDAQLRTLLVNELEINPNKLVPILNYDGMPITADKITRLIGEHVHVEVS